MQSLQNVYISAITPGKVIDVANNQKPEQKLRINNPKVLFNEMRFFWQTRAFVHVKIHENGIEKTANVRHGISQESLDHQHVSVNEFIGIGLIRWSCLRVICGQPNVHFFL